LWWAIKVWAVERRLRKAKRELELSNVPTQSERGGTSPGAARPSSGLLEAQRSQQCCPSLDEVQWGIWAALSFLISSIMYLIEALLDPNVGGDPSWWHWLNWGQWKGMADAEYADFIDKLAAIGFLVNSIIGLLGRYSIIRQVPDDDKLSIMPCTARGFFSLDWAFWGDLLFFIGSICGVMQAFQEYNEAFDWALNGTWFLNAVCYIIASYPVLRALLKSRTIAAAQPST